MSIVDNYNSIYRKCKNNLTSLIWTLFISTSVIYFLLKLINKITITFKIRK